MIPFALLCLSLSISPRFPPRIFMSLSFEWPNTHWSSLISDTALTKHHLLFQAKQLFFSNLKQFIWLFLGWHAACNYATNYRLLRKSRGATQCKRPHPRMERGHWRNQAATSAKNPQCSAPSEATKAAAIHFHFSLGTPVPRIQKNRPRSYWIAVVQMMMLYTNQILFQSLVQCLTVFKAIYRLPYFWLKKSEEHSPMTQCGAMVTSLVVTNSFQNILRQWDKQLEGKSLDLLVRRGACDRDAQ